MCIMFTIITLNMHTNKLSRGCLKGGDLLTNLTHHAYRANVKKV